jgi:hypothetical protein
MGRVIIGMDPHKRSATIEIIDSREKVLGSGRFGTDRDGYTAMLKLGRQHKDRVWAVEGCNGIDRHIAQRLVADGEIVPDVPAKLSARARLFDTRQGPAVSDPGFLPAAASIAAAPAESADVVVRLGNPRWRDQVPDWASAACTAATRTGSAASSAMPRSAPATG